MAYRGGNGTVNTSSGSTVSVTVSGIGGSGPQYGDIVLASGVFGGSGTATVSSPGFSPIPGLSNVNLTNSANTFWAVWKIAGVGEPAAYVFTSSTSDFLSAQVRVYSSVTTLLSGTPVTSAVINTTSPANVSLSAITTGVVTDLVVLVGGGNDNVSTSNAISGTGFGNARDDFSSTTNTTNIHGMDIVALASGSTGAKTAVLTFSGGGTAEYCGYMLALGNGPQIQGVAPYVFAAGQTGIVVTGISFGASQGSGSVVISPSYSATDASAVTQTVTSWGATSITITTVRGSLAWGSQMYLFVFDSNGNPSGNGWPVTFQFNPTTAWIKKS